MFPSRTKCVIWDLDDTLWDGTLAERDAIEPRRTLVDLIPRLDAKGIVNSICSKNDAAQARAELERLGIWPYCVFPAIAFAPKGQSVKAIIENLQLRPANVLFVDDSHANRQEVAYYNPEIGLADANDAAFAPAMEALVAATEGHSRLEQYRVLEQKREARQAFSSNAEFLRASGITVNLLRNPADLTFKDRIVELVNRANQLNFTASRFPTPAQFEAYVERASIVHGCVFAYDRYGDYGLVGFFAFDESTRKRAFEHFVFSCRIMNMGVEHAVYAHLRRQFGLQAFAPLARRREAAAHVTVRPHLDEHMQAYVTSRMDVPERFRSSIIAGCAAGVLDHYLPAELRPARHDLFHLADPRRAIAGVDTIIYALYGDYGSDAWEAERFSYARFRRYLQAFLDANAQRRIVLLLASEKPFPPAHRPNVYARTRGWLSDLYRGKTRRRMLRCNAIVRDVCRSRPAVATVDAGRFVATAAEQIDPRHFARSVVQRLCAALPGVAALPAGPSPAHATPVHATQEHCRTP